MDSCKSCGPGWDYSGVMEDGFCPRCVAAQRDALLAAAKAVDQRSELGFKRDPNKSDVWKQLSDAIAQVTRSH